MQMNNMEVNKIANGKMIPYKCILLTFTSLNALVHSRMQQECKKTTTHPPPKKKQQQHNNNNNNN